MRNILILAALLFATTAYAAPPTDHDGSGTESYDLVWDTMVEETNPASARYRLTIGEGTPGSWVSWDDVTGVTVENETINLPAEEDDITIELEVTDRAGNANDYAADALVIAYAAPSNHEVEDDFSTDTSADYTVLSGTLVIESGSANADGGDMRAWHETELSSANMYAQATVTNGNSRGGGLIARRSGSNSNYYLANVSGGEVKLYNQSGFMAETSGGTYTASSYEVRFEVETSGSDNICRVYLDGSGTAALSYTDSGASANYNGTFAGITIGNSATDHTLDDFAAGAL
jgi:hypothetical protein